MAAASEDADKTPAPFTDEQATAAEGDEGVVRSGLEELKADGATGVLTAHRDKRSGTLISFDSRPGAKSNRPEGGISNNLEDAATDDPMGGPPQDSKKFLAPVPAAARAGQRDAIDTSAAPTELTGTLHKYSVGRSFFGSSNWKKRFVIANAQGLTYSEDRNGKALGHVAIHDARCRLVTAPTAQNHEKAQYRDRDIVIIFTEKSKELRLLLRCANPVEHREWCAVLASMCPTVNDPSDMMQ